MKVFYSFFAVLFVVMFILRFIDANEPEDYVSIKASDALTFYVEMNMPIGALSMAGGAPSLMEADFFYESTSVSLDTSYSEEGDVGRLVVRPVNADRFSSPTTNQYTVALSSGAPIDLQLERESGNTTLHLADVLLSRLGANLGNGLNVVQLRGNYPILRELDLHGNRQVDRMWLDGSFSALARVQIDTSHSADDVYLVGSFPQLASINIDTAADPDRVLLNGTFHHLNTAFISLGGGDDRIVIAGELPVVQKFTLHVGTGEDEVDLTGLVYNSIQIEVISEAGSTTLYLPTNIGVAVEVNGLEDTTISTRNLRQQGELWVNEAFGSAEVVLTVIVNTSAIETVELIAGPPSSPLVPPLVPIVPPALAPATDVMPTPTPVNNAN